MDRSEPTVPGMQIAEGIQRILEARGVVVGPDNWIQWDGIPLPYRSLLVHKDDMTSTLENYYSARIGIEVLGSEEANGLYLREVILKENGAGKAVEYGVIEIDLNQFKTEQRQLILEGKEPLGGILNRSKANYTSGPLGYIEVNPPAICQEKFGDNSGKNLYGRYNQLVGNSGEVFATIVEILPS